MQKIGLRQGNNREEDWQRKEHSMEMIEAKNLVYEYIRRDEEGNVEGCPSYTKLAGMGIVPDNCIPSVQISLP